MTRGEKFAKAVRAQYGLNLAEDVILTEVATTMDVLDALPASATVEARQQRALLSRLLYQLALPEEGETSEDRKKLTSVKASRAARARWNRDVV